MGHAIGLRAIFSAVLVVATAGVGVGAQDRKDGMISGRVTLPSGMAAERVFRVRLSNTTIPLNTLYTNERGEFRFELLSAGEYLVEVIDESGRFASGRESLRLRPSEQAVLAIELREVLIRHDVKPRSGVTSVAELGAKVPVTARREYERGVRFARGGNSKEAIACFERSLAIFPNYVKAHNDIGVQFFRSGWLDVASTHFEAAIGLDTGAFNPRFNLGLLLVDCGEYERAADHLRRAIDIDTSQPAGHLTLGIALLQRNDDATAYQEFQKAYLFGGDSYAVTFYYLAIVFAKRGDRPHAIENLKVYLKKAPTGTMAESARAMIADLSK